MKNQILFILLVSSTSFGALVQSSYQQGDEIGPRWAPSCQHVLHCDKNPGRTLDINVKFSKVFQSVPKVLLALRLLDFQGDLELFGYITELTQVTKEGFTVRYTATDAAQFYTILVRYLATDDSKVHVQYTELTDLGAFATQSGEREKTFQIPIVGWTATGNMKAVSYVQGYKGIRDDLLLRTSVEQVKDKIIFLKLLTWGQTRFQRIRIAFFIALENNLFISDNVRPNWEGVDPFYIGKGERTLAFKLPIKNPGFQIDKGQLFGGITGYYCLNTGGIRANCRLTFLDEKIVEDQIQWNYKTWADSQIRFIDVQFILIKASTDRVSDRGCAILFDQCQYEGNALEICDRSNNLSSDGFTGKVKSVQVPEGKILNIYTNQNLGGQKVSFSSSQECLPDALDFKFIQMN